MPPIGNPRRELMAQYLVQGMSQWDAYLRAGYAASGGTSAAAKIAGMPDVQARKAELQGEIAAVTVWDRARVIQDAAEILAADHNDLTETTRVPCRFCWGLAGQSQWRSPREFQAAKTEWAMKSERQQKLIPEPDDSGGYGYTTRRQPNSECIECDGYGILHVMIHASRGKRLFAGVRQTQHGIEILTESKQAAIERIAKAIGAGGDAIDANAFVQALTDIIKGSASKLPLNREGTLLAGQDKAQEAQEE